MLFTASFSDCSNVTITPRIIGGAVTPNDIYSSLFAPIKVNESGSVSIIATPNEDINYAPALYHSSGFEAGASIKTTPGILYSLYGFNSSSSNQFIQIHNSSSFPNNGEISVFFGQVTASSNFQFTFSFGLPLSNGIQIVNSSTPDILTSGSNDCWFCVQYK